MASELTEPEDMRALAERLLMLEIRDVVNADDLGHTLVDEVHTIASFALAAETKAAEAERERDDARRERDEHRRARESDEHGYYGPCACQLDSEAVPRALCLHHERMQQRAEKAEQQLTTMTGFRDAAIQELASVAKEVFAQEQQLAEARAERDRHFAQVQTLCGIRLGLDRQVATLTAALKEAKDNFTTCEDASEYIARIDAALATQKKIND